MFILYEVYCLHNIIASFIHGFAIYLVLDKSFWAAGVEDYFGVFFLLINRLLPLCHTYRFLYWERFCPTLAQQIVFPDN